jgi:GxxExxY protein
VIREDKPPRGSDLGGLSSRIALTEAGGQVAAGSEAPGAARRGHSPGECASTFFVSVVDRCSFCQSRPLPGSATDWRVACSARSDMLVRGSEMTGHVIGAAIEVHRTIGPGLLESIYERCLTHELRLRGVSFARQVRVPVTYKGTDLDCGYRVDLVVNNTLLVELKSVDSVLPIHQA